MEMGGIVQGDGWLSREISGKSREMGVKVGRWVAKLEDSEGWL
jgi:hypothetical protein